MIFNSFLLIGFLIFFLQNLKMKNFNEFRRKINFESSKKKIKGQTNSTRIPNMKKDNYLHFNFPITNYYSSQFNNFWNKNKNNAKTLNHIFTYSNSTRIDSSISKNNSIKKNKKMIKVNNKSYNYYTQGDKISSNITSDSTINITDNISSCKSYKKIKTNQNLENLKERCLNLFKKYTKILENLNKNKL
jgi:hypothetical protein